MSFLSDLDEVVLIEQPCLFDSLHEDAKPAVVQGQMIPAISPTDTIHVHESVGLYFLLKDVSF